MSPMKRYLVGNAAIWAQEMTSVWVDDHSVDSADKSAAEKEIRQKTLDAFTTKLFIFAMKQLFPISKL